MMAKQDPNGLTTERNSSIDQYTGTADALVATGLIQSGQLPGQPGRPKTAASYYAGKPISKRGAPWDDRYRHVYRLSSRKFCLLVGLSADERERRRQEESQRERRFTYRLAQLRAQIEERELPSTHSAYRSQVVAEFRAAIKNFCAGQLQPTDRNGYNYDAEAIVDFEVAAEELVEILEIGATLFDRARHAKRIAAIRAGAAREDTSFQRFLATARDTIEQA